MVTSFDRRQTLKRKREESSEPFIDDSHEEGLCGDSEGHKQQPSASEFQQLQPLYEEALKRKDKWELEHHCKELEKKCEELHQQKQALQIVHGKFKSTANITEEALMNDNTVQRKTFTVEKSDEI